MHIGVDHYRLGASLERQGKIDEAVKSYRASLEAHALELNYLALARVLQTQQKVDESVVILKTAARVDSLSAYFYRRVGEMLLQRSELPDAERCLRTAIRLDPANRDSQLALSRVLRRTGAAAAESVLPEIEARIKG